MTRYTKFVNDWVPWPSTLTPISSAFLEWIEQGIVDIHNQIELTTEDLNTVKTPGTYVQSDTAEATLARNYPVDLTSGHVSVESVGAGTPTRVLQVFTSSSTTEAAARRFWRTFVSPTWSPWVEVATKEVVRDTIATALVQGTGMVITVSDPADTITLAADPEYIRDTMAVALVEGTGIDIVVDDAGNTITVAATGVSGSSAAPTFSATATWRAPRAQQNGNTGTPADGNLILWPLVIPRDLTLTGLALRVNAAGTASTARACIYGDNGSFFPDGLVKATSALATTSTGAVGETFTGVALPAGLYWVGALSNGTSPASLEAAVAATNTAPDEDWSVMPHGTGSLPSINAGNDGSVAIQTGQSSAPATFGGSLATDKNSPKTPMWVCLKVNR